VEEGGDEGERAGEDGRHKTWRREEPRSGEGAREERRKREKRRREGRETGREDGKRKGGKEGRRPAAAGPVP
jgi:hypothetical protein